MATRLVGITALLLLQHTSALAKKRQKLKKLEVSALSLTVLDGGTTFCAGAPTVLKVSATLADGQVLDTSGREGLRIRDFTFHSPTAQIDAKGVMYVENTGLELLNTTIRVEAGSKRTDHVATAALRPGFGCPIHLDYSGGAQQPGASIRPDGGPGWGLTGASGAAGSPGEDGDTSEGGGHGGGGGRGGPGPDAHSLQLDVGSIAASDGTPLALVVISGPTVPVRSVLLDPPRGGTLHVSAGGGTGGPGGSGGAGGDGGDGDPDAAAGGDGGDGGDGGTGGPGGSGGQVVVRYDERQPALAQLVTVSVGPGPGGSGGVGGSGGSGGDGYQDDEGSADGADGSDGADGRNGPSGPPGSPGSVTALPVPSSALFEATR